ncbi:MAG TPA: hypothetical protein VGF26_19315 [Ramlibacter sp.]
MREGDLIISRNHAPAAGNSRAQQLQREIGHGDERMIRAVYGQVQAVRYRMEILDYSQVPRGEAGGAPEGEATA